jgi:hypothetical protein
MTTSTDANRGVFTRNVAEHLAKSPEGTVFVLLALHPEGHGVSLSRIGDGGYQDSAALLGHATSLLVDAVREAVAPDAEVPDGD